MWNLVVIHLADKIAVEHSTILEGIMNGLPFKAWTIMIGSKRKNEKDTSKICKKLVNVYLRGGKSQQ